MFQTLVIICLMLCGRLIGISNKKQDVSNSNFVLNSFLPFLLHRLIESELMTMMKNSLSSHTNTFSQVKKCEKTYGCHVFSKQNTVLCRPQSQ